MNAPAGFDWVDGKAVNIHPWSAMFNRAALHQGVHMTNAAFCATGFAVAGIHAMRLIRQHPSKTPQ
jgi:cytochrome d ubiquinol oxidase subunit I